MPRSFYTTFTQVILRYNYVESTAVDKRDTADREMAARPTQAIENLNEVLVKTADEMKYQADISPVISIPHNDSMVIMAGYCGHRLEAPVTNAVLCVAKAVVII